MASPTHPVDALIIGQGLAGTTLAWALLRLKARLVICDDPAHSGASMVAAGLATPVTGRALRVRGDFAEDMAYCRHSYRLAEMATGQRFWQEKTALRLFADASSMAKARAAAASHPDHLVLGGTPPAGLAPLVEVGEMPQAARLDVAGYCNASRTAFEQLGCFAAARVAPSDVEPGDLDVHVATGPWRARVVIWCGGAADSNNAWLPDEALRPARGEMIRVHLPGLATSSVMHRAGHWLRPLLGANEYQFGATYDHDDPVPHITDRARATLMGNLSNWIEHEPRLIDQVAGVRPVAADRQPFARAHAVHRRVLMFNGLGSHGVLAAPRLAHDLAKTIVNMARVDGR